MQLPKVFAMVTRCIVMDLMSMSEILISVSYLLSVSMISASTSRIATSQHSMQASLTQIYTDGQPSMLWKLTDFDCYWFWLAVTVIENDTGIFCDQTYCHQPYNDLRETSRVLHSVCDFIKITVV